MKYSELIQFQPIESVIELRQANKTAKAKELGLIDEIVPSTDELIPAAKAWIEAGKASARESRP